MQGQHHHKSKEAGKKAKKQKHTWKTAAHTSINDWSSEDSDGAAAAPMAQLPARLSHSDEDEPQEGAAASADAPARNVASPSTTARKSTGTKAGYRRQKKVGSKGKKARVGRRSEEVHAKVNDWTSDDSSDAGPAPLPDLLDSMSDSESDSHAANRTGQAAQVQPGTAKPASNGTQMQESHVATGSAPPRPLTGDDVKGIRSNVGPARVESDDEQQTKHAKRRGRLRKARASPAAASATEWGVEDSMVGEEVAAPDPGADDVMVELEDDLSDNDDGRSSEAGGPAGLGNTTQKADMTSTKAEKEKKTRKKRRAVSGEQGGSQHGADETLGSVDRAR